MAYKSGIRRERARRRQRFIWRAMVWLLVAAGVGALGWSAYQTGTVLAESRVTELLGQVSTLTAERDRARTDNGRLQAALGESRQATATLQGRYDSDVPKGDMAELFGLVRDRLAQGVTAARLTQILQEAGPVRPCEGRFTRKRFAIAQPGRSEEGASLLEGLIQVTVTAQGSELKTASVSVARAWASEPLKLTGLPAKQDVAINNIVLHLTVEPSELAGYAYATLTVCGKA
jgi:hypothetical protein